MEFKLFTGKLHGHLPSLRSHALEGAGSLGPTGQPLHGVTSHCLAGVALLVQSEVLKQKEKGEGTGEEVEEACGTRKRWGSRSHPAAS